jgi:hypothetical protein
MRYRIEISRKALDQLRALPREQRRSIGWRMEEMREDLRGDVLKLQAKGNYYRLRVGNFRVPGCCSCWQGMRSKCMLLKTGKKLMNDTDVMQKVEALTKTVERLQGRVEDLEDLRDLQSAIAENGSEPLIPWEQAKANLELD